MSLENLDDDLTITNLHTSYYSHRIWAISKLFYIINFSGYYVDIEHLITLKSYLQPLEIQRNNKLKKI